MTISSTDSSYYSTLSTSSGAQNSTKTANEMDSGDFLTLLTTQLQNQDPFAPMENGEFLSQLAEMSTVSGIEDLNDTLTAVATAMGNSLISQASTMVGQKALVDGSTVYPDENGLVEGRIGLEGDATNVIVTYRDADTDDILNTQRLGGQPSGALDFSWAGAPTDGTEIRVNVTVESEDGTYDASTAVYARIEGVEIDPEQGTLTVQVQDYGSYLGSEITALR